MTSRREPDNLPGQGGLFHGAAPAPGVLPPARLRSFAPAAPPFPPARARLPERAEREPVRQRQCRFHGVRRSADERILPYSCARTKVSTAARGEDRLRFVGIHHALKLIEVQAAGSGALERCFSFLRAPGGGAPRGATSQEDPSGCGASALPDSFRSSHRNLKESHVTGIEAPFDRPGCRGSAAAWAQPAAASAAETDDPELYVIVL